MLMLYFSATGNSKYVAELFSKKMNAVCHSIEENTDFTELIKSNETIGFCYPIFGSRVPKLMREFIMKHIDSLINKKLIIFCTQMYFSGDGARALTDILPRGHVEVIYAEHFLMPNNVCNVFITPIPGEKTINKYLSNAERKMQIVCENIKRGVIKKRGFNPCSRALGLIQGAFFPGIERRARGKVRIDNDCNKCGFCVYVCPMGNFEVEGENIAIKNNCMMCYRCINKCPQKAIRVFLRKKVKKQYKGL